MNPFLINTYQTPQYFCNREDETKEIIKNIKNNTHTTLFAQRKLGKTALIKNVFYHIKNKNYILVYADIYSAQNIYEFTKIIINAIYQQIHKKRGFQQKFLDILKFIRPKISFNELTGIPELTIDYLPTNEDYLPSLLNVLRWLNEQSRPVVIAIDEFQQILTFSEKNIEAQLRTHIQNMNNLCFIFSGSNYQLMNDIFYSYKRPFYGSTFNLRLSKISNEVYAQFIHKHFTENKRKIEMPTIEYILQITDTHTYYTQFLCHELYAEEIKNINVHDVNKVLLKICNNNFEIYMQIKNLLTSYQWKILKAIACEKKVYEIFASKFIQKYHLRSPSMVNRAIRSLLSKELVYFDVNNNYYELNDKFLMYFFQHFVP